MVLRLKARKSRSPPGPSSIPGREAETGASAASPWSNATPGLDPGPTHQITAGWSSPVARQAHNLKVIGSNPIPATKFRHTVKDLRSTPEARPASGVAMSDRCPKITCPLEAGVHFRLAVSDGIAERAPNRRALQLASAATPRPAGSPDRIAAQPELPTRRRRPSLRSAQFRQAGRPHPFILVSRTNGIECGARIDPADLNRRCRAAEHRHGSAAKYWPVSDAGDA